MWYWFVETGWLYCMLVMGIAYIVYFVRTRITKWDVIGGVVLLAVLSVLLITLPEGLLKDKNTSYVFKDAGWYEQYIDDGGAIIDGFRK